MYTRPRGICRRSRRRVRVVFLFAGIHAPEPEFSIHRARRAGTGAHWSARPGGVNLLLLLRRCLPAAGHGLARSLARARVRSRALTANRQSASVSEAAVAADFDQALDVQVNLTPKVAFDLVLALDNLAQADDLVLGEVFHLGLRTDLGLFKDLPRECWPDAVDIAQ